MLLPVMSMIGIGLNNRCRSSHGFICRKVGYTYAQVSKWHVIVCLSVHLWWACCSTFLHKRFTSTECTTLLVTEGVTDNTFLSSCPVGIPFHLAFFIVVVLLTFVIKDAYSSRHQLQRKYCLDNQIIRGRNSFRRRWRQNIHSENLLLSVYWY